MKVITILTLISILIVIILIGVSTKAEGLANMYLPIINRSGPILTPTAMSTLTSTPTLTSTNIPLPTLPLTSTNTPTITLTPTATRTPTTTSTPTKTATPTITPTPTNTPTPQGVYIKDNHTYYEEPGHLYIVGEVYNGTDYHLRFVNVSSNVFINSGHLTNTDSGYVYVSSLAPKTSGCFEIVVINPGNWAWYTLHSLLYWTDAYPPLNLTLYNHSGSYDSYWGDYEIIGLMRNDDTIFVDYANAIATLYDLQGNVIGCDFGYGSDYSLNPGQVTSFTIWSTGRDYADVAYYSLVADDWK